MTTIPDAGRKWRALLTLDKFFPEPGTITLAEHRRQATKPATAPVNPYARRGTA